MESDGNRKLRMASSSQPTPVPLAKLLGGIRVNQNEDGEIMAPVALRKVSRKPIFENFTEEALTIKPPTRMLRYIDTLRYHRPTDEEREALNIISSKERLHVHDLNDVLVVCGGRKGYRFEGPDISRLRELTSSLATYFGHIDTMFQSLPQDVLHYKFHPSMHKLEDDPIFIEYKRKQSLHGHFQLTETSPYWQALEFQYIARKYIDTFSRLKDTVLSIRKRLDLLQPNTSPSSPSDVMDTPTDPVEVEFEAKAHHPFPPFLLILIEKFHRERRHHQDHKFWTVGSKDPPVESIAQFALYLSNILFQRMPMTYIELKAMETLLQVVKVSFLVDYEMLMVEVLGGKVMSNRKGVQQGKQVVNLNTLVWILFEFLDTVRELRHVPRRKEMLPETQRVVCGHRMSC